MDGTNSWLSYHDIVIHHPRRGWRTSLLFFSGLSLGLGALPFFLLNANS